MWWSTRRAAGNVPNLSGRYSSRVDLGPASGTVIAVGLRTTTVRGLDGTIWYVRNGEILRVGNSSQGEAVVDIDLTVPYGSDTTRAGAIALRENQQVASRPEYADSVLAPPVLCQGGPDGD